MAEGDADLWYCYYAVMKLKWKPSEFAFLPPRERALMYAFIDERMKEEQKQRSRMNSSASRSRRRGS